MKTPFLQLSMVVALGATGVTNADTEIYRHTLRSTAWVISPSGTGTGVLVDADRRLLVTNHHVVAGARDVFVIFPVYEEGRAVAQRSHYLDRLEETAIRAHVVSRKQQSDLALVELERLPDDVEAIRLSANGAGPGEQVHSIGNPGDSDDPLWVYTPGSVRQASRKILRFDAGFTLNARVIETTSPINPGDSGGPVVNEDGELVGVVQSVSRSESLRSICIDASEIRNLLDASASQSEAHLRSVLDQLDLDYLIDDDLSVIVVRPHGSLGGGPAVFVDLEAESAATGDIRRIWSPAFFFDESVPGAVAVRLLQLNHEAKLGAWEVRPLGNQPAAVFCCKVPAADASAESVRAAIDQVLAEVTAIAGELASSEQHHARRARAPRGQDRGPGPNVEP